MNRRSPAACWLFAIATSMASASPVRADEIEECAAAAEKGQDLRDQSKLVEAKESILRCAQSTCPKMVRGDCEKWLPEIEVRIPTVVFHVVDDAGSDLVEVKVERNGAAWLDQLDGVAIAMNPGATKLRFSAQGFEPQDKEIVVAESQRGRIVEIALKRSGSSAGPSPTTQGDAAQVDDGGGPGVLPWTLLGVGVAGLGTFAVTQVLASGEVSDVEDGCGKMKTCADAELDPIRTKLTISAIGLGVGIAGVGASIVAFVLMSGSDGDAHALQVIPVISPTTAGAVVDLPLSF